MKVQHADDLREGKHVKAATFTFLTELALVTADARTFAINTFSMTVTIRDFAFVMPQVAFLALPAWIALTFAVYVLTAPTTKHWTNTCRNTNLKLPSDTTTTLSLSQSAQSVVAPSTPQPSPQQLT